MSFTEHDALQLAVSVAQQSPCAKSKRGVVIWKPGEKPIAYGFNHPPFPMVCDGSDTCRKECGKICVHAEQDALLNCRQRSPYGCEMLHVEVLAEDGKPVSSGPPSCWQCSKLILQAGIKGVWLLHDILERYTTLDFHRLTLVYNGLPATEGQHD